ncbi:MAG: PorT family protein [bacterium]|nr:MAG: PorT family protein [bacterium]
MSSRYPIVIVVLLACSLTCSNAHGGSWTAGLKAGLNLADAYGDDSEGAGSRKGLIVGGFIGYRFTDFLSMQDEVYFTMKGSEGRHPIFFAGNRDVRIRLAYLEVPILVRFHLPLSWRVVPNIFAGPAFAIMLYNNADYEYEGRIYDINLDPYVKSTDIGVILGGGVDVETGMGSIVLEARYEWGLVNIPDETPYVDLDLKNSALSFMIGYAFR